MLDPYKYSRGEKFMVTAFGVIIVFGLAFWMLWVATAPAAP